MNNKTIIQIDNLCKTYYSSRVPLEVLKSITLSVFQREIISIVGESGCGKSTLLNLIGGLDNPTEGKVIIDDHDINKMKEDALSLYRNQNIGFVFQFHYLLPDFTAIENVMLPYLAYKFNKKEAKDKALNLLKEVNLEERCDHRPNQLSGGEQQRVAIARALINDPLVVLADEPTGNLDEKNSNEVTKLLWKLREDHGLTIILVTHDQSKADLADRKVRLVYGKLDEIYKTSIK